VNIRVEKVTIKTACRSRHKPRSLGDCELDSGFPRTPGRRKKLFLSHLVPAFPSITDDMWLAGVRKNFSGEAIVGRDLQDV
jgi:hypothetical protein